MQNTKAIIQQPFYQKAEALPRPPSGLSCLSCNQLYNHVTRKPTKVCSNRHTICEQCAYGLRGKPKCPFCSARAELEEPSVDRSILEKLPPMTQKEIQLQKILDATLPIFFSAIQPKTDVPSKPIPNERVAEKRSQEAKSEIYSLIKPVSLQEPLPKMKKEANSPVQLARSGLVPLNLQSHANLQGSNVQYEDKELVFKLKERPKLKFTESKTIVDQKPNSNHQKIFSLSLISPLPLRFHKRLSQESDINKLNGFSNAGFSERNPQFDANQSDVERSQVQQFQPQRLVNLNQELEQKGKGLRKVEARREGQVGHLEGPAKEEPFELRKWFHEADWLPQMGELPEEQELSYLLALSFQLFFMYFNFHFATSKAPATCLDHSLSSPLQALRPLLLASLLYDFILTLCAVTLILLYLGKLVADEKFRAGESIVGLAWLGKLLVWDIAQAIMLMQFMRSRCSGPLLLYTAVSLALQTVTIIGVLVKKCSESAQ